MRENAGQGKEVNEQTSLLPGHGFRLVMNMEAFRQ